MLVPFNWYPVVEVLDGDLEDLAADVPELDLALLLLYSLRYPQLLSQGGRTARLHHPLYHLRHVCSLLKDEEDLSV